ncbi:DUF1003 domain-containing protein [Sphingomonas sp. IC-11]|uniref:DUF1003 domain-containing protein n=1 Tax=Sphingomonas sp. IC-11 TaxID=2898528 RepID=UPI001E45FE12|nr:DUF1003 domain-containing protein [Sphingomonas sp. IC-11]MCD2316437.1 DUF1003 domain-containing protein [Sphingomonas sp. IC-11]
MQGQRADLEELALHLLGKPPEALDEEERRVLTAIASGTARVRDASDVADERATFGERLADRVAEIGGSWGFITVFALVLLGWMLLNSNLLAHYAKAFDPYPFIFLNLMLSTLAAVQAPVIMMSQNRQAAKDRLTAALDYETNLRAELEILRLHRKMDQDVIARLTRVENLLEQKREVR